MTFQDRLRSIYACSNAIVWVGKRGLAKAWAECERADWMLWLCDKMIGQKGWPTRQEVVLAACDCAETVKHPWLKGDKRPAKTIKTVRAWANGKASIKEVREAAADAAADTAAAADAAVRRNAHIKMCKLIRKRLKIGSL